jgi:uncharacterized Zn finger protein (UPF0148 family)
MKNVIVWHCERCGLDFVRDDPPQVCPQCRRHYSGPVTIRLAGRAVEVASVRLYGDSPLKDASVTANLDSLRLGMRCPHNWIAPNLCPECP